MNPSDFQRELTRIAGLNPFGLPVLRLVDGEKEVEWIAGCKRLKYPLTSIPRERHCYRDDEGNVRSVARVDDVPEEKFSWVEQTEDERGEERQIVERWRSAEFLAASGRFRQRRDDDGTELLPELPPEGHYDFFMRLQRPNGEPHPADEGALEMVRALWAYEHSTTLSERNQHAKDALEAEMKERDATIRKRKNDLWGFDPDEYVRVITSAGHQRFEKKAREI